MPVVFYSYRLSYISECIFDPVLVPVELFSKPRHILGEEHRNTLDVLLPMLITKIFDLVEYEYEVSSAFLR